MSIENIFYKTLLLKKIDIAEEEGKVKMCIKIFV